jgi:hypothetical protein
MTSTLGEDATAAHQKLITNLQERKTRAEQVAREHGATREELRKGLVDTDVAVEAATGLDCGALACPLVPGRKRLVKDLSQTLADLG